MTARFKVVTWPPIGPDRMTPSFHVYDRETRSEVLGRWDNRDDAQAHADQCNERQQA